MIEAIYRGLAGVAAPALALWLDARERRGKEDPARIAERRGVPSLARPAGRLAWMHAASVGEAMSILPLAALLRRRFPETTLLLTTGTVTSARLLADRLPAGCLHQFMPLDVPAWIARFLDHWRPDAAIWVESELWPNTIAALRRRGVKLALINARMSPRSFARWRSAARLYQPPLDAFDPCLAQDETSAARLAALGAAHVQCVGNLKFDAAELPVDEAKLAFLRTALGGRPVWLAASLHPGEAAAIAAAHKMLAADHRRLLTLVVPRHPERRAEFTAAFAQAGLTTGLRSESAAPDPACDIYIADTLGELGVFYRLARIAFIGGSLTPHGGQNALEGASLGNAILFGPHMQNFAEIAAALLQAGGAEQIADADVLGAALRRLMADSALAARRGATAREVAERGRGAVGRVADALAPLFQSATVEMPHARA